MDQIIQIVGAVLILVAYAGAQLQKLQPTSIPYLILNLVGSAILAVLAALDRQWGFLLLEGVWAALTAAGLAGRFRKK